MIKHLSYSSINHYLNCSRSWRYRYVNKLDEGKSEALLFGSAWHKMIGNMVNGTLDHMLAWRDGLTESLPDDIEDGQSWITNINLLGSRILAESEVRQHIKNLKPSYHEISTGEYAPYLEHKFEFTIPQVEVPVIGYIDMINEDMTPIDFKTSSRRWTQKRADNDLQATFYIAGMHSQGLIKSDQFPYPFEYHVFTKTKNPEVQVLRTYRTAEQVLELFELIKMVWDAMKSQMYLPNPNGWQCSEKYCSFWQHCEGGAKK